MRSKGAHCRREAERLDFYARLGYTGDMDNLRNKQNGKIETTDDENVCDECGKNPLIRPCISGDASINADVRPLLELSLEELWLLFPIELVPHNDEWAAQYAEEELALRQLIGKAYNYSVNHVGSTSINNIWAKPIVDILIEADRRNFDDIKNKLMQNGWLLMHEMPERLVFNKGYTPKGFADKVFHLHLKTSGDNKEIIFRDYMNTHSDAAHEYEKLKLSLLPEYKNNRDGYTEAKTEFCDNIMRLARAELGLYDKT